MPRWRVGIIRHRASMRTTTIIAALVLASVGAPAQADYQSDYFDPPEQPKQQITDAPIVRPFLDGSCPSGYTKRGSKRLGACVNLSGAFVGCLLLQFDGIVAADKRIARDLQLSVCPEQTFLSGS
jgi:hypothetical protein